MSDNLHLHYSCPSLPQNAVLVGLRFRLYDEERHVHERACRVAERVHRAAADQVQAVREQESLSLALRKVEELHLCGLSEATNHVLGWTQEQGGHQLSR
jgi:RNase H-fold protein (predicted Holliday junction resolvase)